MFPLQKQQYFCCLFIEGLYIRKYISPILAKINELYVMGYTGFLGASTIEQSSFPWSYTVRQRHIGDFTQWQNDTAFERGFERLIRDLRESR